MSDSLNRLKLEKKGLARQQQVISAVNTLVQDIERCEKTITDLKTELETVNLKHQGRRTTRDDIAYLTDLLECSKKKLNWEKHMASLQKRTPEILKEMSELINDPKNPPPDQVRAEMLRALQGVQAAMEKLHGVKVE
jgi:chromosome segregation ATPase